MSLPARREALATMIRELAACSGVHSTCCKYCPSKPGNPIDPETAEILALPRDERIKTIFPCAWGPKKFCRGYFDRVGADESDLPAIERERRIKAGLGEPTQDAEVLEQGLNAAQERWARLVSDVVCGRPR